MNEKSVVVPLRLESTLTDYDERDPQPWETQLYVAFDTETAALKIGIARDPERRVTQLRTANPRIELRRERFFGSRDPAHVREIERITHAFLADYNIGGEWFAVSLEAARMAISMAERLVDSAMEAQRIMQNELYWMERE